MTTAAELSNEAGQSIIEFLMMLPMMIGMTVILVRINTAIQVSIVDQQYARAQALFLTYNGAWYPELSKVQRLQSQTQYSNQLVVGVSDNSDGSSENEAFFAPSATTQLIARNNSSAQAPNDPQMEPATRNNVRIRNTVTLCTPTVVLGNGTPLMSHPSNLTETTNFNNNLCASLLPYE